MYRIIPLNLYVKFKAAMAEDFLFVTGTRLQILIKNIKVLLWFLCHYDSL